MKIVYSDRNHLDIGPADGYAARIQDTVEINSTTRTVCKEES